MGNQEVVQINFGVAMVSRTSRYEVGPARALDATRQAKDTSIVRKVNASIPDRQGQGFFTATQRGQWQGLLGPRRVYLPSPSEIDASLSLDFGKITRDTSCSAVIILTFV